MLLEYENKLLFLYQNQITETAIVSFSDHQPPNPKDTKDKGSENEVFESDSLLEVTGSLENDGAEITVKASDSSEDSGEVKKKKKKQKKKRPSPG